MLAYLEAVRTEASQMLAGNTMSVLLSIVGTLMIVFYAWSSQSKKRYPAGPFSWPIVGNLLAFRTRSMLDVFDELKKKHGPVFTVHMGPVPMVVLNDYPTFKEALITRGSDFAGRYTLRSSDIFTEGQKDVAFHDYDEEFKVLRRIVVCAIKEYLTGSQYELSIQTATTKMLDVFEKTDGTPVDPRDQINLFVVNLLGMTCWNVNFEMDDPRLTKMADMQKEFVEHVGNGFLSDLWAPLALLERKKLNFVKEALKLYLDDFVYKYLKEHEDTFDEENLRDLTDYLIYEFANLKKKEPEVAKNLTRQHLGQMLADVFSAGTDTSKETLSWWILFMAGHPEVQEKAYKEIQAQIGDKIPGKNDRKNMPYLEAIIQETTRLGVVAPTLLPHKTICDTSVGGQSVPKDTLILINAAAIMVDPTLWKDPKKFNPDRFINGEDVVEALVPFGAGKRVCAGMSIAKTQLFIITTMILQRFSLRMPEGAVPNYEWADSAISNYAKDYKVEFVRRYD